MATAQNDEHNHPAWKEGRKAFVQKWHLDDCPYDLVTDEFDAWRQGWQEAMADEEKMTPKYDGRR